MKRLFLIGYSGHSFVVADSANDAGYKLCGYFENRQKDYNPFQLDYLGTEDNFDFSNFKSDSELFIAIGDNFIREKVFKKLSARVDWSNIIDPSANVSKHVELGKCVYIGKNSSVNAICRIGNGVIINTAAIIEHECNIEEFSHVAPGAVLCGNVTVGAKSFIGANSVVKQGVKIGKNVIIGAGSVVIKDVEDGMIIAGNPAVQIK